DSLNSALGMQSAINAGNQMTWEEKAQILGIDDQYDKPDFLTSDYEYEQMMREARYFVVVMAYDYQLFRKKGTRKLLWSTRYNIRTSGQSFETAIKEMNEIGSSYFGKNFEKLMRKRQDDDSKVEIGDIEVLKTEEERE
ncbi:MAG: hypothetical protein KJT03_19010, partial [Verrucomicrobiae bacterium]|nr:hypothetical protein [Verrucomicrobiae bacterium]